jgi:hypothetical protein
MTVERFDFHGGPHVNFIIIIKNIFLAAGQHFSRPLASEVLAAKYAHVFDRRVFLISTVIQSKDYEEDA